MEVIEQTSSHLSFDKTPKRMNKNDRERQIIDQAIAFFAKHGFEGQIRELTQELGIKHTLLYHYFPTKQDLIERVYQEVFEGRWKVEWEEILESKNLSPENKLIEFYVDYAHTILTYDFVRILIFSGLSDHVISDRFFKILSEKLIPKLIKVTRQHWNISSKKKPSSREIEHLMGLHGGIFYLGVRRFIYGQHFYQSKEEISDREIICDRVRTYLMTANHIFHKDI